VDLLSGGFVTNIQRIVLSSACAGLLREMIAAIPGGIPTRPEIVGASSLDEVLSQTWPEVFP
jgi:hypothetical protein